MDYAYLRDDGGRRATPLARTARAAGVRVVDGIEVLLAQTRKQILGLTGRRVEVDTLRRWLAGGRAGG